MAECIEAFLASLKARKYSPATLESRRGALQRFTSFLAENDVRRFQDVTRDVYAGYRRSLLQAALSQHTVENYLAAVRMLFDYLDRQSRVFENPTRFEAIRRTKPPLPKVIPVEDVRKLLAAPDCSRPVGLRDRAILEVLYGTGVRMAELLGMATFDVDADRQTVRVMGKGSKERVLPTGKHATRYLRQYLATVRPHLLRKRNDPDTTALWLTFVGKPATKWMVQQVIERHAQAAQVAAHVNCHALRRSCATHMLQNGAQPMTVAAMLGHADLTTLSHYLRVTVTDLHAMHRNAKPGQ